MYVSVPTATDWPSTIASVSGSVMMKREPLAERRAHFDRAAELLDVSAHDVHADAAAGNVRRLFGRGEAGHEDQLVDLPRPISVSFGPIRPRERALARMRSLFRPPPSSPTSTVMLPPL